MSKMSKPKLRTRLIVDLRDATVSGDLVAILGAGDVACALLPSGSATDIEGTVRILQSAGVAALVCDDVELAIALEADGVHLSTSSDIAEVYAATREKLPEDRIVGTEIGPNRHVAMVLAEAGADYMAFTLPDGHDDLQWWSEIFEVPSVALGSLSPEEAANLARHGVEFISAPPHLEALRALEGAVAAIVLVEA